MSQQRTGEHLEALLQSDPKKAAAMLKQLQRHVIVPHDGGQADVYAATQRFQVVCAGRRWGKTKIAVKKALRECRKDNRIVWWVAPTYKVVARAYREAVKQIPPGVLIKTPPPPTAFGRLIIEFKSGSRLEFYSAENPDAMVGEGVNYVVIDEAATINENVFTQIIRPTLMDTKGSALLISTPRGFNWFRDLWVRGQDPEFPDYASWHFPTSASPYIDEAEIEEAQRTLPAAVYEQEILAEFVSAAGAVFRFGEKAFQGMHEPGDHVTMGVDLAKHHDFTVLTAVDTASRLPVFHDRFNAVNWPTQRQRIRQAVADIQAKGAEVTMVVDSTGLGDVIYDDLEAEGYDVIPIKFTQAWKQGAVFQLQADLERGAAFILPEQRHEFEQYGYEMSEITGRFKFSGPENGFDDEVSAKLLEHHGVVHGGIPNVTLLDMLPSTPTVPEWGDSENEDYDLGDDEDGAVEEFTIRPPTIAELFSREHGF